MNLLAGLKAHEDSYHRNLLSLYEFAEVKYGLRIPR